MPANQAVGTYTVQVYVRTSTAVAFDAVTTLVYKIINPPATSVTLTPDQPSPHRTGTQVVFTASGQGSTAPYMYAFNLWQGTTLVASQGYSATSTWTMPANQAPGAYTVEVFVRTNTTVAFDATAKLVYSVTP
jgi:hypothetical protein